MPTFATAAVTVTFESIGDGFNESRDARVAVQEIPGGDAFYVDRAGRGPLNWTVAMFLASSAAYGQLNAALGQEGTLSVSPLDTHSAVLMKVSRPSPLGDGRTRATAEFLITDA